MTAKLTANGQKHALLLPGEYRIHGVRGFALEGTGDVAVCFEGQRDLTVAQGVTHNSGRHALNHEQRSAAREAADAAQRRFAAEG